MLPPLNKKRQHWRNKPFILSILILMGYFISMAAASSAASDVEICHNGNTIHVNENAVQAHMGHGDTLGPCGSENATETPTTPQVEPSSSPIEPVTTQELEPGSTATETSNTPQVEPTIVSTEPVTTPQLEITSTLRTLPESDADQPSTNLATTLTTCEPEIIATVTVLPSPHWTSTLSDISLHYYETYSYWSVLAAFNNIPSDGGKYWIYPNQIIRVPRLDTNGNPTCQPSTPPTPTPDPGMPPALPDYSNIPSVANSCPIRSQLWSEYLQAHGLEQAAKAQYDQISAQIAYIENLPNLAQAYRNQAAWCDNQIKPTRNSMQQLASELQSLRSSLLWTEIRLKLADLKVNLSYNIYIRFHNLAVRLPWLQFTANYWYQQWQSALIEQANLGYSITVLRNKLFQKEQAYKALEQYLASLYDCVRNNKRLAQEADREYWFKLLTLPDLYLKRQTAYLIWQHYKSDADSAYAIWSNYTCTIVFTVEAARDWNLNPQYLSQIISTEWEISGASEAQWSYFALSVAQYIKEGNYTCQSGGWTATSGTWGTMQVGLPAACDVFSAYPDQFSVPSNVSKTLFLNEEFNIQVGAAYLNIQIQDIDGDIRTEIAAGNLILEDLIAQVSAIVGRPVTYEEIVYRLAYRRYAGVASCYNEGDPIINGLVCNATNDRVNMAFGG